MATTPAPSGTAMASTSAPSSISVSRAPGFCRSTSKARSSETCSSGTAYCWSSPSVNEVRTMTRATSSDSSTMSSMATSRTVASLPANQRRLGIQRAMLRASAARRRSTSGHVPASRGGAAIPPVGSMFDAPLSIANHMNPYGVSVSEYGRSVTGEKRFWPNTSTGTVPVRSRRSSSTCWASRDRLATHSNGFSPGPSPRCGWRMNASTCGFSGSRNSIEPRPSTRWRLRRAISWRIHDSSDAGLAACVSTLTDS